ncbi:protein translocase subunit SecF [Nakamurella deserti]|uniref:protein translocase subunit SecF n=1 Tax=Nakamurella deserti TaxID=2164074 RepID=UPI000DBE1F2B|nr:protein translocase subunit SecF [Nakamurella deserti]
MTTTTPDVPTVPGPKPPVAHRRSFLNRLTTGTGAFDIIGHRRKYYIVSLVLVVLSIALIIIRGFNFGIDFAGGTRIQFPASSSISTDQVAQAVAGSTGVEPEAVQTVGTGASATFQVQTTTLSADQVVSLKQAVASAFNLTTEQISDSAVSETWGGEISQRAVIALVVFLIAVSAFLWIRYERRVAIGAVIAVVHDMIITAGIYALVGFEVTPATVIGLLAILGFSLYDTVVVYDKVQENTKGLTSLLRRNFEEAANLAVNQTLMRSVNTTVIALLPVGGLLVAGVAILGSGTLKDLALVQLVGMIVSGYSSVFLAVPIAVDLRLRDPLIKAHTARVAARRKAEGIIVDADGDAIGRVPGTGTPDDQDAPVRRVPGADGPTAPPKPGVKAQRTGSRPVGAAPRPVSGARPAAGGSRPVGKAARPTGKRAR